MTPHPSPADSHLSPRATITAARVGRTLVLRLAGEFDLDSTHLFEEVLLKVAKESTAFTLDLSRLGFCDSTGLNLLLRLHHQAEKRGVPMHLAAISPQVARVLEITGTDKIFHTHPTLEDALTALAQG